MSSESPRDPASRPKRGRLDSLPRRCHAGVDMPAYSLGSLVAAAGSATGLSHYATPAAASFFQFRESAGAVADGDRDRHNLFAVARFGRFGAFAEGYRTLDNVRRGTTTALVPSTGAFLTLDWRLTGEPSDVRGLAPARGQWGAWQLVARMAQINVRSEERRVGKEGRSRWSPYH